jgi:integrase
MSNEIVILKGQQAKQALRQINLAKGVQPLTLNQAAKQWGYWRRWGASKISVAQYNQYLERWLRNVGHLPVTEADENMISAWVNEGDVQAATKRFKLAVIRSFFRYLSARELLNGHDPSRLVTVDYSAMSHEQKESKRAIPFQDFEFFQLLNHLNARMDEVMAKIEHAQDTRYIHRLSEAYRRLKFWHSAAILGRCTGLRMGDVCQIEWAAFSEVFTVWTDKRNKRVQPAIWNEELWRQTFDHMPRIGRYCFPIERETYVDQETRHQLPMHFGRLCKQAGLDRTFHGLRHAYATDCMKKGIPTPHISRALGHSDEQTTQIYLH